MSNSRENKRIKAECMQMLEMGFEAKEIIKLNDLGTGRVYGYRGLFLTRCIDQFQQRDKNLPSLNEMKYGTTDFTLLTYADLSNVEQQIFNKLENETNKTN